MSMNEGESLEVLSLARELLSVDGCWGMGTSIVFTDVVTQELPMLQQMLQHIYTFRQHHVCSEGFKTAVGKKRLWWYRRGTKGQGTGNGFDKNPVMAWQKFHNKKVKSKSRDSNCFYLFKKCKIKLSNSVIVEENFFNLSLTQQSMLNQSKVKNIYTPMLETK